MEEAVQTIEHGSTSDRWIVPGVLAVSGAAALVYQVAWIRLASLAVGSTTEAVGLVLAVFFLGLALGSHAFGRASERTVRPLRLLGQVEVALGLIAAPSPWAFDLAEAVRGLVLRTVDGGVLPRLVHALVLGLVILPPTVLMGASLPLATRWLVRSADRVAAPVGWAYATNTLGAAAGASATGFLLLPLLGLRISVLLAAAAQAAVGALLLARPRPAISRARSLAAPPGRPDARWAVLAALFFLCGFSALALEVVWTRYLRLILENTIHTYTLTLAVVLAGIVLGSALAGRVFDRRLPLERVFGALQVLVSTSAVLLLELPPPFWSRLGGPLPTCAALLLPGAVLGGACFPLAARLAIQVPDRAGQRVGGLAAVNTLGGILGALLASFVLLPRLGLEASVRIVAGTSLAAGVVAWLGLDRGRVAGRVGAAAAAVGLFVAVSLVPGTRVPEAFLAAGRDLVDHREGHEGHLAVLRESDGTLVLEIDRWWQGQDRRSHQVIAAHLPMLLHPDPRRVLCVGVGAGQTPSRFLRYDVERVDCVDIEPAVFDLIREHFDGAWLDDPRVRAVHADGRSFLAHAVERWDVIEIEIGQTFRPGAAGFYTADLYRRARERLAPGGVLVQFVPLAFLTPQTLRGVVRTFVEVFPESLLWYNASELLLVGTTGSKLAPDPARMALLGTSPAVQEDLHWAHWGGRDRWLSDPAVFLGGFIAGPRGLQRLARGGRVYRDDRPVLEYATLEATEERPRELALLPLLREALDSLEGLGPLLDAAGLERARSTREGNLADLAAGALMRAVDLNDPASAERRLDEALRHNPGNLRAWRMLGDARYLRGDHPGAEEAYARLIGQGVPVEEARAHRGLGLVLAAEGRHAEAAAHYRAALVEAPDDAQLQNMLGAALGLAGDLDGAAASFREAVRLKPDYAEARRNLETTRAAQAAALGAPDVAGPD